MAFATKHPLQEGGVEYNITVIGNKQIGLLATQMLQTTEGEAIRSLPNQLGNHPGREPTLNSIYRAYVRRASQLLFHSFFPKQIPIHPAKQRVLHQGLYSRTNRVIAGT